MVITITVDVVVAVVDQSGVENLIRSLEWDATASSVGQSVSEAVSRSLERSRERANERMDGQLACLLAWLPGENDATPRSALTLALIS